MTVKYSVGWVEPSETQRKPTPPINSFLYLLGIFIINYLFGVMPTYSINGSLFSSCDFLVGAIFILRDFAQQEIGKKVLYLMLIGCALSYLFANKHVAIASLSAFAVSETLEWLIFTYTRKPLAQRLLTSSLTSVPIDSILFLYLLNQLNLTGFIVLTTAKMLGIISVWLYWRLNPAQRASHPPLKLSQ